MLIRLNVGSALNPTSKSFEDNTVLRDVFTSLPDNAQITLDGVLVTTSDLGKTLADLNIRDGAHILYSSKQNSGLRK